MFIPFVKYSGCGNDFVIIDNRSLQLIPSQSGIQRLCHRQCGVGADGVIFLENPNREDALYRMRIFNADGSEAEMCGNGLRCLAHYIHSIEKPPEHFYIETMHQRMEISYCHDFVSVGMPSPAAISQKEIIVNGHTFSLYFLDTGVPHAVYFTDDIEKEELFSCAAQIRFHQAFHPHGTNVNFVKILPNQSLSIRTYERGVEQETLACGTGATAAALAFAKAYGCHAPVKVHLRSGDFLSISFKGNIPLLADLVMTGPATKVFEGNFSCEMFGFQLKSSAVIL